MAGLQSLWLDSRLKPWLRTIDGLGWLMGLAASHGGLRRLRTATLGSIGVLFTVHHSRCIHSL